jgi:hypothetical protein
MTQIRFFVCVAIVAALLATGCRRNHAPKIESITANPAQVQPGGTLQLNAVAVDQDKDSLSYQWMASGGFLSSSQGVSITWKAPDSIGTYAVRLAVSDKAKGSDTGSVKVTVAANVPPTIGHLTATPLILNPRGSCALTVTASDPKGRTLSYLWSTDDGQFSNTTAAATGWTAPSKSGTYSLKVAATDSDGLSTSDSITVEVRKTDNASGRAGGAAENGSGTPAGGGTLSPNLNPSDFTVIVVTGSADAENRGLLAKLRAAGFTNPANQLEVTDEVPKANAIIWGAAGSTTIKLIKSVMEDDALYNAQERHDLKPDDKTIRILVSGRG